MAATQRTPQAITRAGLASVYTAADNTNGETCPNDGLVFIHVKNTGGSPCTVSIAIPGSVDGQTVPAKTVTVPATTGDRMIGPFSPNTYNDSNNSIGVSYSTGTGVTAAYIHLG